MNDQWGKGAKYWDHAWNPVIGCKPVSEGCEHCYAKGMSERFPELQDDKGGFDPHPAKPKKPPRKGVVFIGNMTDLFGEWNSREYIRSGVCLAGLSHVAVNLVLTKRAKRLPEVLIPYCAAFPHVWYGVTAENDARFQERAPYLVGLCDDRMRKPGNESRLWLSLEPLLGPISLNTLHGGITHDAWGNHTSADPYWSYLDYIDWVVVGAESGPNRRPCKIEWVESIVEKCQCANVPVFVKQLDINGRLEKDINKFPPHLQIRQVPWEKRGR